MKVFNFVKIILVGKNHLIQFPIQGQFREILLILEALIVVLNVEFGIIILNKFVSQKGGKYYMHLTWGLMLFCFSGSFFLFIISDFYVSADLRPFYLTLSYISIGIGESFLAFNLEKEIKIKRHPFTIITLTCLGLLVLNIILNLTNPTFIAAFLWGIYLILFIYFGITILSKIRKSWKIIVYKFLFGAALLIVGWAGFSDIGVSILGIGYRFLGDIFVIIGTTLTCFYFLDLPRLAEVDYLDKIKILYVMHNSGRSLFQYDFQKEGGKTIDSSEIDLKVGGLTSITQFITELVKSKENLEEVDYGDIKLLFSYGNYIIMVLIVEKVLEIVKNKLKSMTIEIEDLYQDLLSSWDGDIKPFDVLRSLTEQKFDI